MIIRPYRPEDFEEIASWWRFYNEPEPMEEMMSEDGTFVLEVDGAPSLTLTAFTTQGAIGYLEGYCARPYMPKEDRRRFGQILWDHAYRYLRERGKIIVICYSDKEKLVKRYQELGMYRAGSNLISMVRILGEE